MDKNLKAFVLMPFDPEFNSIYEDLIKPALEDAGYDVARADSFLDQQNILRDIVRGITNAHLIVADLTNLNPNVLYELGLCHGQRIPTVLLAQSMEEVPFDLRSYRILIYTTRFDQVHKLKQSLKEIGEKHKTGTITFSSPIIDFLPHETRILTEKTPEILTEKSSEEVTKEVEEEKGVLDFVVEGEEAAGKINEIFLEIAKETEVIGNKMKDHTKRIQTLTANPGPGTSAQAHKLVSSAAMGMIQYSENIERNLPILDRNTDVLIESSSSYVNWIKPNSEKDREQFATFRQSIDRLSKVTKEVLEGARSYRNVVASFRSINIAREINRASRRLTQALDGIISVMEKVEAFCVKTLSLIDEKIGNQFKLKGEKDTAPAPD